MCPNKKYNPVYSTNYTNFHRLCRRRKVCLGNNGRSHTAWKRGKDVIQENSHVRILHMALLRSGRADLTNAKIQINSPTL